jgi:hypothetical protein
MRIEAGDVILDRNIMVFINGRMAHDVMAADEAAGYIETSTLDHDMEYKIDYEKRVVRTHRRYGRINLVKG